jgi:hypothetical protein
MILGVEINTVINKWFPCHDLIDPTDIVPFREVIIKFVEFSEH